MELHFYREKDKVTQLETISARLFTLKFQKGSNLSSTKLYGFSGLYQPRTAPPETRTQAERWRGEP